MSETGQSIHLNELSPGLYHLVLDAAGAPVNAFGAAMIGELDSAVNRLYESENLQGLLISSAKSSFVVGADITEFGKPPQAPTLDLEWSLLAPPGPWARESARSGEDILRYLLL